MLPVHRSGKQLNHFFAFFFFLIRNVLIREEAAIRELQEAMQDTKFSGRAEGAHVHIVHLSDAKGSLDLIKVVLISYLLRTVMYL